MAQGFQRGEAHQTYGIALEGLFERGKGRLVTAGHLSAQEGGGFDPLAPVWMLMKNFNQLFRQSREGFVRIGSKWIEADDYQADIPPNEVHGSLLGPGACKEPG